MATVSFGTISHGTLREVDLLETFADHLETLYSEDGIQGDEELLADTTQEIEHYNREGRTTTLAAEIIAGLMDALNEFAPPYSYFGAHPVGDGSDFGFWPSMESLEEAVRDGEIIKVSDLSEAPTDWHGEIMVVSDHGNVTLYAPHTELKEVWAIV
jgi:hypothetical protein